MTVKVRDQRTGKITVRASVLYTATFNHGKVEETFYALDHTHASEVAHEIAARRGLMFDAVQRKEKERESDDEKTT